MLADADNACVYEKAKTPAAMSAIIKVFLNILFFSPAYFFI
jgi:hypothetical protein